MRHTSGARLEERQHTGACGGVDLEDSNTRLSALKMLLLQLEPTDTTGAVQLVKWSGDDVR